MYGVEVELDEIFDDWRRNGVEGMRDWRADISDLIMWVAFNEPEKFGELEAQYHEWLSALAGMENDEARIRYGEWKGFLADDAAALLRTGVGGLGEPAKTSRYEWGVEPDGVTKIRLRRGDGDDGGFTGDPGQRPVAPPVSTTTPPPTTTVPPPTTTPPPTTVPPRTIPVTPDTGPEVTAPPTTTVPPRVVVPPTTTEPFQYPPVPVEELDRPDRHANVGQGWERHMGYPGADVPHGYAVNNYGSLMPTRGDWSQRGWDPVFNFVGALVSGLFNLFDDPGPVGGGPGPSGHPGQRDRMSGVRPER